jgi:hypothetical protein
MRHLRYPFPRIVNLVWIRLLIWSFAFGDAAEEIRQLQRQYDKTVSAALSEFLWVVVRCDTKLPSDQRQGLDAELNRTQGILRNIIRRRLDRVHRKEERELLMPLPLVPHSESDAPGWVTKGPPLCRAIAAALFLCDLYGTSVQYDCVRHILRIASMTACGLLAAECIRRLPAPTRLEEAWLQWSNRNWKSTVPWAAVGKEFGCGNDQWNPANYCGTGYVQPVVDSSSSEAPAPATKSSDRPWKLVPQLARKIQSVGEDILRQRQALLRFNAIDRHLEELLIEGVPSWWPRDQLQQVVETVGPVQWCAHLAHNAVAKMFRQGDAALAAEKLNDLKILGKAPLKASVLPQVPDATILIQKVPPRLTLDELREMIDKSLIRHGVPLPLKRSLTHSRTLFLKFENSDVAAQSFPYLEELQMNDAMVQDGRWPTVRFASKPSLPSASS